MVGQVQPARDGDSVVEDGLRAYLAAVDLDRGLVELVQPVVALGGWWELTVGADGEAVDPGVADGLNDDAVRSVWSGLVALGLPEQTAEQVLAMGVGAGAAAAGVSASVRDQRLVDGVQATMLLSRFSDAAMLGMVRDLAVAAGQELLARRRVAGVEELSTAGQVQWRAQTKSAVAAELQALNGWGIQSCHDRVAVALAPGGVAQRAQWALANGWVDLRGVLDFWRRARNLDVEAAAVVAQQTLGPASDGDGVAVRASREQFRARLHRAVTAAQGADAAATRAQRRAAVAAREATTVVNDDGTATFSVTGGTAPVVAAMLRVDSVARRARHQGDQRTLAQLRADLALALLVHGTLPDVDADLEPSAGQATTTPSAGFEAAADDESPSQDDPTAPAPTVRGDPLVGDENPTPSRQRADDDDSAGREAWVAEPGPVVRAALAGSAGAVNLEVIVPLDALLDPDSTAVGYLPGFGPISAEHAREIAATTGTTIHRLLTDPADGRCVERSIASYRPDQAMLDQLRAGDRTCRSPGCTRDVAHAQPDHVQPWQASQWTAEPNLAYEHSHHHHNLTLNSGPRSCARTARSPSPPCSDAPTPPDPTTTATTTPSTAPASQAPPCPGPTPTGPTS